ncbi:MAG: fused MFS/spermidine synthase [Rhodocyclaceae bacterium]|nr:fused MFS/spermidine synthase [Rhodocyclaceae bacterium]
MEIQVSESAGVRYLHFGSNWVQGAMRVARPWALELDYTREMMAALLLRPAADWPRSVLLIGLGTASLTKFLHRHRPAAKLTVVEIEPAVVATAQQYFKLPAEGEGERLRIVIGDGAEFVAASQQHYDLILVDGFDADARTGMLDSLPFYLNCKARLTSSGLMVANLLSKRRSVRDSLARIAEAFDGRALSFPPCASGNVVAFATAGTPVRHHIDDLKIQAKTLKENTGLDLQATLTRLAASRQCPGGRVRF